MLVQVALTFCESLLPPPGAEPVVVSVDLDERDTIAAAKEKIARALLVADGNNSSSCSSSTSSTSPPPTPKITGKMLMLHFGPNDAVIGAAYSGDPTCDEATELLGAHSALSWLRRFPRWRLGVRPMPPPPPPPGEAAHRAAAQAEGKDPDRAVEEARAKVREKEREKTRKRRGRAVFSSPVFASVFFLPCFRVSFFSPLSPSFYFPLPLFFSPAGRHPQALRPPAALGTRPAARFGQEAAPTLARGVFSGEDGGRRKGVVIDVFFSFCLGSKNEREKENKKRHFFLFSLFCYFLSVPGYI